MQESGEKVVTTTCASHCGGTCLLKVHVKDGVITRIETDDGPEPQLRGCLRGRAHRQKVYAPDRLLYPLKRTGERGEGKFERVSWDEALGTVAKELIRVRDTYGPASIIRVQAGGDLGQLHRTTLIGRILGMIGGYTATWGNAISFQQGVYASQISYGTYVTASTRDNLLDSRFIILWGWNPSVTICGTNSSWYLAQAREAGAKIVVIDPRYTDSVATFADQWIPIRPGTDAAMLIAMAYVMITENLQDQSFLDSHAIGFDKYKDYVLGEEDGVPKTPAWAEAITGVPAATIENLAREYATIKPGALMCGIGPGRTAYGEQYHRAAITLSAMTGNIGVPGGDPSGRTWESRTWGIQYKMGRGVDEGKNPVEERAPAPPKGSPTDYNILRVHISEIPDFILKGKAGGYPADGKFLWVLNCSYLNQFPNTSKIVEGLKALEFMVVEEQFMTPTAKFADIVLPTNTFLERNDIDGGVGLAFYGYVHKAIETVGEAKSHLEIARGLAKQLGLPEDSHKEEEEWLREMVKDSEIPDYEEFKEKVVHWVLREPLVPFREQIEDPANNSFPTPSGKIEIYSQTLADLNNPNLPPIPKYIETWESVNDPLVKKYPLQLITTHLKRRSNNQYETIPWLRELEPQAAQINPIDAQPRGIKNDDTVRVFNDRGEIIIPVRVTERIMPGVFDVPEGAWYDPDEKGVDKGACANVLTNEQYSPGGGYAFNTALVEVQKLR